MTTDFDMKIDYMLVLQDLRRQLDGIGERRRALEAAVEAVKVLVATGDSDQVNMFQAGAVSSINGSKPMPAIPPGLFAGKTPTQAHRELMKLWPREYSAPQIADAFLAGGMAASSRTMLIQSIHSVRRRERLRNGKDD